MGNGVSSDGDHPNSIRESSGVTRTTLGQYKYTQSSPQYRGLLSPQPAQQASQQRGPIFKHGSVAKNSLHPVHRQSALLTRLTALNTDTDSIDSIDSPFRTKYNGVINYTSDAKAATNSLASRTRSFTEDGLITSQSSVRAMETRRRYNSRSRVPIAKGIPWHSNSTADVEVHRIMGGTRTERGAELNSLLTKIKGRHQLRDSRTDSSIAVKESMTRPAQRVINQALRTTQILKRKSLESKMRQQVSSRDVLSAVLTSGQTRRHSNARKNLEKMDKKLNESSISASDYRGKRTKKGEGKAMKKPHSGQNRVGRPSPINVCSFDDTADDTSSDGSQSGTYELSSNLQNASSVPSRINHASSALGTGVQPAPVSSLVSPIYRHDITDISETRESLPSINAPNSREHRIASEVERQSSIQREQQRQQHKRLMATLRGEKIDIPHVSPASFGVQRDSLSRLSGRTMGISASPISTRRHDSLLLGKNTDVEVTATTSLQRYSSTHAKKVLGPRSLPSSSNTGQQTHDIHNDTTTTTTTSHYSEEEINDIGAALAQSNLQSNQWACKSCTFINSNLLNLCEMCETPRLTTSKPPLTCGAGVASAPSTPGGSRDNIYYRNIGQAKANNEELMTMAPPSQVVNLRLHGATPTSLFFKWDAPKSDGGAPIAGYILESKSNANEGNPETGPTHVLWQRLYFGIARDYLATELDTDSEYTVRIACINSRGLQSCFSSPSTYRTLDNPTADQGFEIPPLRVWGLWAEYWDPPSKCCYYYNRSNRQSSWEMPLGMKKALENEEKNGKESTDFRKISSQGKEKDCFRQKDRLSCQKVSFKMKRYRVLMNLRADEFKGFHELEIRREHLITDSFTALNQLEADFWRRRFKIKFKHEDGLDAGGLSKDWFLQLSKAICDPACGLFTAAPANGLLMPARADVSKIRKQCRRLEILGLFLAKAICDRQVLDVPLCPVVLKHILGLQDTLDLNDLAFIDPILCQSLQWIRSNKVADLGLDMYFTVSVASVSEEGTPTVREQDLLPGGKSRLVTEKNKHQYVQLLIEWYTQKAVQRQLQFLCRGFHALLPLDVVKVTFAAECNGPLSSLSHFTKSDCDFWRLNYHFINLNTQICAAQSAIDVQNGLRAGATYSAGLTEETQVVEWFWEVIEAYSPDDQQKCLEFITGCSKVPLDGFMPPLCLCGTESGPDALPRAHTCFNQLMLPKYTTKKQLSEKLTYAISNTKGFQFA